MLFEWNEGSTAEHSLDRSKLTIGFQGHKLPDFPTPVELLMVFQGGLDVSVDESFVDDLPKLWTKLASSEHFKCVSVHGFKMMTDSIGRFQNIFGSSLSYLHSFPHIAQVQSLRKELFSHGAPQHLRREKTHSVSLPLMPFLCICLQESRVFGLVITLICRQKILVTLTPRILAGPKD